MNRVERERALLKFADDIAGELPRHAAAIRRTVNSSSKTPPMTTKEMQNAVYMTGSLMSREQYAGTNAAGWLISRHRWAVHDKDGRMICRGDNPAQCFKSWREVTAAKAPQ